MRGGAIRLAAIALLACLPTAVCARHYPPPPPPPGYYDGDYDRAPYRGGPQQHRRRFHHCDNGTGGTILGAIAGGLLGNTLAGRGDRALGSVVGAGAGALAGRAIDRDCR